MLSLTVDVVSGATGIPSGGVECGLQAHLFRLIIHNSLFQTMRSLENEVYLPLYARPCLSSEGKVNELYPQHEKVVLTINHKPCTTPPPKTHASSGIRDNRPEQPRAADCKKLSRGNNNLGTKRLVATRQNEGAVPGMCRLSSDRFAAFIYVVLDLKAARISCF